jgi:putative ABC transport system ATP-binding protein
MAATVQGNNLTKVHKIGAETLYALAGVSLEIYPGEMVAIRGRPSSSKSTLLHVLGGMQRPDSGSVSIDGQDLTGLPDEELARVRGKKVGFLFEAFNLLPNETALRNVEVPLRHQGYDAADSRDKAAAALQVVGLGNRLEHRPGQLTARQRQCVAIARALANDPSVIFADEPTRALDSSSREEIIGLLQKLNDEGRTIVLATSDSGVASHCRRIVRLSDGKTEDDSLVSRRRIIPAFRIPGPPTQIEEREEEAVCPRCNHGNPKDDETCQRCRFPLQLTEEEQHSIEIRLSGADNRHLGVESASDEGQVSGQGLVDELKKVPVFAGLGSKSLVKLVAVLDQQTYPKGSTIVKQGDAGDSFYIVRRGNVQVIIQRPGRPPAAVASLGPNDGFGEMSLLTGEPRSADVVAETEVNVWRLPKQAFDSLLEENLSLAVYFNRILAQRLRTLQEKITT